MNMYTKKMAITGSPEYDEAFWNAMRGNEAVYDKIEIGREKDTGTYAMPSPALQKFETALNEQSIFRNIASVVNAFNTSYSILAKDTSELSKWVPENGEIPIYDGMTEFTKIPLGSHKLAAFLRLDEDFVKDAAFDIEGYLTNRFAKNFVNAEDAAFISGTGKDMPTGILCDTGGADVGVTTGSVTFDDVQKLYFSLKPEYRAQGSWLMNDETALYLRGLKDTSGSYLWRGDADTLLGKPVFISESMPSAKSGAKPIAFGDFSYYWIAQRKLLSVKTLVEKFTLYGQIGYLAFEFLDGKLIRPEAVKVLQLTA